MTISEELQLQEKINILSKEGRGDKRRLYTTLTIVIQTGLVGEDGNTVEYRGYREDVGSTWQYKTLEGALAGLRERIDVKTRLDKKQQGSQKETKKKEEPDADQSV